MRRALLNTLVSTVLFAACLIAPVHAWTWDRAWALVGVFLLVHAVGAVRITRANPDLLRERARMGRQRGQPAADKVLLLAFVATYSGMLMLSAADARRWHVWPAPGAAMSWLGLGLFAAGWCMVVRTLETNAFAVRVVRHQPERGHRLVDWGVYRVVRHPMYAGLLGVMAGAPLWLGSWLGLLAAVTPMIVLALRIVLEERVLRGAVAGYDDYTRRVRRRLIPGVW
jgi:protein-S-isoprenylcysteine O-methyltransferase Ste14